MSPIILPGKLKFSVDLLCEVIWAAALISLPLTSFPLLASITGAIVAPLTVVPFFILFFLSALPLILRKGELPRESIPLGVFILFTILSCAVAFFLFIPGFKGKTLPSQELRAFLTLLIGVLFFLVTVSWVKNLEKLHRTWKYITIGGVISLVWAGIQAFYIFNSTAQYPTWLELVQSWLVVLSPSFLSRSGRVNGLTYEPSWYAHQMVMIYLPIWLAATYYRTSAFKFRLFHLSLENFLVVIGLITFFLSSPRIGLISLFIVAIFFFMRINLGFYRKIVHRIFSHRLDLGRKSFNLSETSIRVFTSLVIVLFYVVLLGGVILLISQRDWRMSIFVTQPPTSKEIIGLVTLDQETLLYFSNRFVFLERVIYWMNGWNVFNQYPWLGVGLGNAGFFFPKYSPPVGWETVEIRNVLYHLPQLPNVKSFWLRLLAETGLAGFSIFIAWMVVLFRSSGFTQHHSNAMLKTFALAGQLALLAFIGEGFSIDSFAMPYLWVATGLLAASSMIARQDEGKSDISS